MRHNFLLRSAFFLILVFFYTISYSQTKIITGIVSDNNGIPLSGATLSVPGINVNAVTGTNGIYSIRVPIATSVLTVSYVGMRPVEVSVNNQSVLNITLENADSRLSEVVVVGYGTKRRSDISSSISSINEDDIKDLPVSGIDQALQGKVSGVTVTSNSGQPGAGVSVRVRGVTS